MNNDKYKILLHDYFDNLLTPEKEKEFEDYLLDNLDLAMELGKLKTLRRRLNNLPSSFSPDPIVIEHIYNSLLEERREEPSIEILEEEEKVTTQLEKKEEKKVRKLKAKTKYRLKKFFSYSLIFLFIVIIAGGYYYYTDQNKTTPWHVEITNTSGNNITEKDADINSVISTSANEQAVISIADLGKIELQGKSKIKITEGRQTVNKIIFNYGNLIFIPTQQNKLFQVQFKNLLLESKQAEFKISSVNKKNKISVITSFVTIVINKMKYKIPLEYSFNLLNDNAISIPLSNKAASGFSKLAKKYSVSGDEKILEQLIYAADKEDIFTLHYLLYKVPPVYREKIILRLHNLLPALTQSKKEKILFLDDHELNSLWDELFSLSLLSK